MNNIFFINPTNVEEVLSEIKHLSCNKSTGPCSVPIKFLKSVETVRQLKSTPTRKLSRKAFILRSAITIKIFNKYIHYSKIVVLEIVQNNSVI